MVQEKEVQALRRLAARWMEHASQPVMAVRRRQWKAVKDLRAEKPMILVETCMLPDYIGPDELVCVDPFARNIEKSLYEIVRHADEIGDDIVVDPYFRIPWVLEISDYGVPIEKHHAVSSNGSEVGYSFNFAVQSEKDAGRLHLRSRGVNRRESFHQKELLEDIFADILPVRLGGYDPFNDEPGYRPWLGNCYCGLTMDLFKLIGNDRLLTWVYDNPRLLHRIMAIIRDDRKAHFRFMEKEGLLYANTDTWMPCPGSYGFVSDLPAANGDGAGGGNGSGGGAALKDCWCWADSQESAPISPAMFEEFFLPAIAEVTRPFGLAYYGCCEAVHDRFERVRKAIRNLRAVSVSGWSDPFKMAEMLGKSFVYSRKPTPAYISGARPDWDLLKEDVVRTLKAARDCSLEFCFRDIYTIDGDRPRLAAWVRMTRSLMGE
ncbi:MAG TPA: hypothetical protein VMV03_10215 [Spirochaetia bacterium]|nr:hypothetical protein [Spirochaetia bacterium]